MQKQLSDEADISSRFSIIYENNLWSSPESLSGEGSEVSYTGPTREWLIGKIPQLGVRRMVDAGCGDFNWMKLVVPEIDVSYVGLDIVASVIADNNRNYAREGLTFGVANICEDEIPSCDLVMVRDCLFHLSYDDTDKSLRNLSKTDYKYLLTTTHSVEQDFANTDIFTGSFRLIDVFRDPFNFNGSHVLDRVLDYPEGHAYPREMTLLKKESVPTSLSLK